MLQPEVVSNDTFFSVADLVNGGQLRTYFQPIVSVRRKMVMGVEALVRAEDPATQQMIPPTRLFEVAYIQEKTAVLDRAARELALRQFAARGISDSVLLFVNVDLEAIAHEHRLDEMIKHLMALQIPPSSIAVELVESQFDHVERLDYVVSRLREHGMLIAVDDIGSGHSNLERISLIKPNILKIDRSLCSKLGDDHCTGEVFSALVNLGRRIGSLVVAEGIETKKQAVAALERGADLLQGYLIARPQPAATCDLDQALAATRTVAGDFRQHMVGTINHNKIERRLHNILLDSVLTELALVEANAQATTLSRVIRSHPDIECMYVLDHRGVQVTDTIFNTHEAPPDSTLFKPADKGTDHSLKLYYYALLDNETNRYVTEPYVSLASGQLCRTLSTAFRDGSNEKMFVLCIDVKAT